MKLFKCVNRLEGNATSVAAWCVFGKNIESDYKMNGWYILLNLPCITKQVNDFVDPRTYTVVPTLCFRRHLILTRRPRALHKYCTRLYSHWMPVELL